MSRPYPTDRGGPVRFGVMVLVLGYRSAAGPGAGGSTAARPAG